MPDIRQYSGEDPGVTPVRAVTGASEIQQGAAQVQQQLGGLTKELLERKKRLDKIDNNTWLINISNDFQRDARTFYAQALTRTGKDAQASIEESGKIFKQYEDRLAKEAPNDEYKNAALQHISGLFNSYENKLIVHATKEIENSAVTALRDNIDQIAEDTYINGGSIQAIEQGIASLDPMLNLYAEDFGADRAETERKQAVGFIANNAIDRRMRIDPEGTLADIEAGKYSKYITTEDRDKHIKNARAEANWQQKQAEAQQTEAQSEIIADIVKNPTLKAIDDAMGSPVFQGDARAMSTLAGIKKALIKEADKATKDRQYLEALDNPDLTDMTDMQIRKIVPDIQDANQVIKYRDDILKNPSVNSPQFVEVQKSLKADYKAGKFKDDNEYMAQLRTFQKWAIANKEKDPAEYYKMMMEPINAGYFDRMWKVGPWDALFDSSKIDPVARRKATDFLLQNKKPVTPANLQATLEFLKGREDAE